MGFDIKSVCPTRVGVNRAFAAGLTTIQTVCPTRVGVNRLHPEKMPLYSCLPHAGGGEPGFEHEISGFGQVCPTRVGVNRINKQAGRDQVASAPRGWG